mmetsp:Transcript_21955/g.47668  ORF Transcript_21955/g.47668 Transcript_21955/m.47668 type:complete len:107 (+) Transcript_21955:65-385(+)
MIYKNFCLCLSCAVTTAFNPIKTVLQTKYTIKKTAERDILGQQRRMTTSDDFAKIFGKREAQERAQERADQFIDAHKKENVAFVAGPSKNATNTTKTRGAYIRQTE